MHDYEILSPSYVEKPCVSITKYNVLLLIFIIRIVVLSAGQGTPEQGTVQTYTKRWSLPQRPNNLSLRGEPTGGYDRERERGVGEGRNTW